MHKSLVVHGHSYTYEIYYHSSFIYRIYTFMCTNITMLPSKTPIPHYSFITQLSLAVSSPSAVFHYPSRALLIFHNISPLPRIILLKPHFTLLWPILLDKTLLSIAYLSCILSESSARTGKSSRDLKWPFPSLPGCMCCGVHALMRYERCIIQACCKLQRRASTGEWRLSDQEW